MSIADSFKVFGAKQALKYVDRDFEHNAVKMCDWLIEHDKGGGVKNEATRQKRGHHGTKRTG